MKALSKRVCEKPECKLRHVTGTKRHSSESTSQKPPQKTDAKRENTPNADHFFRVTPGPAGPSESDGPALDGTESNWADCQSPSVDPDSTGPATAAADSHRTPGTSSPTSNAANGPDAPPDVSTNGRRNVGPSSHVPVAKRAGCQRSLQHTGRQSRNSTANGDDGNATTSIETFTILNIRGLKPQTVPSKVPYIQDLLQHRKQLFMALTETWLKDHLDAELAVEGYTILRQDCIRQKVHVRGRNYGGVALYIRDDIATSAEPVLQYSNGSVDVLGLHLRTANLMLIVLYRQPDNPASGQRSTSREFSQALDKINSTLSELPTPTQTLYFVVILICHTSHGLEE